MTGFRMVAILVARRRNWLFLFRTAAHAHCVSTRFSVRFPLAQRLLTETPALSSRPGHNPAHVCRAWQIFGLMPDFCHDLKCGGEADSRHSTKPLDRSLVLLEQPRDLLVPQPACAIARSDPAIASATGGANCPFGRPKPPVTVLDSRAHAHEPIWPASSDPCAVRCHQRALTEPISILKRNQPGFGSSRIA
jgi:hypothetical protein